MRRSYRPGPWISVLLAMLPSAASAADAPSSVSSASSSSVSAAPGDDPRRAVVKIFASQSPPNMFQPWRITPPTEATGSGVIIAGGRVLTNAHVVNHAQQIYVQLHESSEKLDAEVEFISDECDLATLRIEDADALAGVRPLELAAELPPLKAKVNVLGYPTGGDTLSVTEGVVSRIEYVPYYFDTAALRIQVDAAVNPGNSGGPGVVDGKITGIVFSKFAEGENIGYLIPAEVIRHFLDDWADGDYDGFPQLGLSWATLENPSLREYLKVDRPVTGTVVHRVNRDDLGDRIRPWDIVTHIDGTAIDNLGMVPIAEGVRVFAGCLVARKTVGQTVRLGLIRDGAALEVEIPTVSRIPQVFRRMSGSRPSYFIYGGLVFTPATSDLLKAAGANAFAFMGMRGTMLPRYMRARPEWPDQELVVLSCPILPHRITKGYSITPLSVVTHVNDRPVRNLRHLIEVIRENREDFLVLRFEEDHEEKVVLQPALVEKFMPEILANNNIPAACSSDLRDAWPR